MKRLFDLSCGLGIAAWLFSLLLAPSMAAGANEWPVARADARASGVAQTELSDAIGPIWTYAAGDEAAFEATAVIAGGVVYVGDTAGTLHAVRLADGTSLWKAEFTDSSFVSAAAVDGDRLYVGDLNGVFRCLSTTNGEEKWSQRLEGEIYAGPTPHGEQVLVTTESGTLASLNKQTGEPAWPPYRIDAPLRCSPTVSAGRVLLAGCDSLLHVINLADGTQTHTMEIDGPTGATPAVHEERVYFGTESGTFFAIDLPPKGAKPPSVAWTYRDPRRGQPIRTAAAVTAELIVFGSQGKSIYALEPNSGSAKWTIPTRSRVESSLVIAGSRVVAATTAGKLYLLNATNGEAKWEYDAGGGFVASPAVVAGRLVIGNTDGTLYCFGTNTEAK